MQPAKSSVHPIIIRWHFFMIPVMLENQDLRPRLFAKTYVLDSPSSLPTHPYKKRLEHFLSFRRGFPPLANRRSPPCLSMA